MEFLSPEATHEFYADRYAVNVEKSSEALLKLTEAVGNVVDAYVKGCLANGHTPAKYIVKLQPQVEELAEKLADAVNQQEVVFNSALEELVTKLEFLQDADAEPLLPHSPINQFYTRKTGKHTTGIPIPWWADMTMEQMAGVLSFLHQNIEKGKIEAEINQGIAAAFLPGSKLSGQQIKGRTAKQPSRWCPWYCQYTASQLKEIWSKAEHPHKTIEQCIETALRQYPNSILATSIKTPNYAN